MTMTTRRSRSIHVEASGVRTPVAIARLSAIADFALRAERIPSYELPDPTGVLHADIYICPDVARAQAREHGVGVREELLRLVVHGVLHATGRDHPVDDTRTQSAMWKRQELLLARYLATGTV
jgi:rRNA maturation RNase YbeY